MNPVSIFAFVAVFAAAPAFADGREGVQRSSGPKPLNIQRHAGPLYHAPTAADCALSGGGGGVVYSSHSPGAHAVNCAGDWVLTDRVIYSETFAPYVESVPPIIHTAPAREYYSSQAITPKRHEPRGLKLDDSAFTGGVGYDLAGGGYYGYGPVVVHVVKPYSRRTGVRFVRGRSAH